MKNNIKLIVNGRAVVRLALNLNEVFAVVELFNVHDVEI